MDTLGAFEVETTGFQNTEQRLDLPAVGIGTESLGLGQVGTEDELMGHIH